MVRIHDALGLTARVEYLRKLRFLRGFDDDDYLLFGNIFFSAAEPRIETTCDAVDLGRIRFWIKEAKARSDIAVFSVHSHEGSESMAETPGFLVELAHAAIDAGADVVVGHGPHRMRGVEI
ncbi:CapA family protein [Sinorhizobium meliloti]|uniref:CapA family protein n=1 Tax=Rhizobium meliloti TaxID=382 RepID=UPI00051809C8|nr:CapA family protein [Sinorhizobium meliloti]